MALQVHSSIEGVVLAGGQSRRMGQDKAALEIAGQPLLARIVARLHMVVPRVRVIGPPERARLVPDVPVIPDVRPGCGALGGIYTALWTTDAAYVLVVGCDMPFLNVSLLRYLVAVVPGYDAAVLRYGDHTEQLHAIYGQACLPIIADLIAAGSLKVSQVFAQVHTRYVDEAEAAQFDPGGLSVMNVNTIAEWQRALGMVKREECSPAILLPGDKEAGWCRNG
jgi:molybdopterin-guanine dinucleotide biosynthesis protein A